MRIASRGSRVLSVAQRQGNPLKKRVTIAELQFGMYIAELDRPWTETPFKFQGFVLKTHEELELLGKYCSVVFVDPDRREVLSPLTRHDSASGESEGRPDPRRQSPLE